MYYFGHSYYNENTINFSQKKKRKENTINFYERWKEHI